MTEITFNPMDDNRYDNQESILIIRRNNVYLG
jgi:hypothetical protein